MAIRGDLSKALEVIQDRGAFILDDAFDQEWADGIRDEILLVHSSALTTPSRNKLRTATDFVDATKPGVCIASQILGL